MKEHFLRCNEEEDILRALWEPCSKNDSNIRDVRGRYPFLVREHLRRNKTQFIWTNTIPSSILFQMFSGAHPILTLAAPTRLLTLLVWWMTIYESLLLYFFLCYLWSFFVCSCEKVLEFSNVCVLMNNGVDHDEFYRLSCQPDKYQDHYPPTFMIVPQFFSFGFERYGM